METPKSEDLSTIRQQMETLSRLNGFLDADVLIAIDCTEPSGRRKE